MPRSTTTSYGTGGVSTWKVGILVLYHAGAGRFHAKTPRSAKTAKKTYRFRCDYVAYATATCFLTKARSRAMAAMSAGSYSRCRESGPAKCAEASSRNTSGQFTMPSPIGHMRMVHLPFAFRSEEHTSELQ